MPTRCRLKVLEVVAQADAAHDLLLVIIHILVHHDCLGWLRREGAGAAHSGDSSDDVDSSGSGVGSTRAEKSVMISAIRRQYAMGEGRIPGKAVLAGGPHRRFS